MYPMNCGSSGEEGELPLIITHKIFTTVIKLPLHVGPCLVPKTEKFSEL
jgi:hypothetical protein